MPMDLIKLLNCTRIILIGNWRNVTNLLVNYKSVLWMIVLVSEIIRLLIKTINIKVEHINAYYVKRHYRHLYFSKLQMFNSMFS